MPRIDLDEYTADGEFRVGNDFFPPFSRTEMTDRWQRCAAMMEAQGYDALVLWGGFGVVFGAPAGQTNLSWLTNYAPCIQGYAVIGRDGVPTIVMRLGHHAVNARLITFVEDIRANYSVAQGAAERVAELGAAKGRIGIVGPHVGFPQTRITVPVEHRDILTEALPEAEFADASDDFESLRRVRSGEELDLLRRAGAFCDSVYRDVIDATKPGVTCTELRRIVNIRCAEEGATYVFCHLGAQPMANPADNYPDFYPIDRPVAPGDALMTELCLGYGTYWGKIWGSWFCGEPTDAYARMHDDAVAAHDAVADSLKPGLRAADLDAHAEALAGKGYELHYPLVNGWSAINHIPRAGAIAGTRQGGQVEAFRDWEFTAGETYTLVAWVGEPGTKRGLWAGSAGAIGAEGFERFNGPVATARHIV